MRRDEKLSLRHRDITLGFDRDRPQDGASFSGHERDHLFANLGFGESYVDISGISGLDHEADSRVSGLLDFNRDGRTDIVVASANRPMLRLYRNDVGRVTERSGRFIAMRFVGGNSGSAAKPGRSPRDGYGAKVYVDVDGRTLLREHRCGEGFAGENSTTMLIGVGERERVDLRVTWPGGATHAWADVPVGSLVTAYEVPGANGLAFASEPYGMKGTGEALVGADHAALETIDLPAPGGDASLRVYTTMATWCASCKREIPAIKALRDAFPGGEIALYGVSVDPKDTPEMLAQYRERFAPAYTLLDVLPKAQLEHLLALGRGALKSDGLPMSFIVDAKDRVRLVRWGVPTVSDVKKHL